MDTLETHRVQNHTVSAISEKSATTPSVTVLMIGVLPLWADRGDSIHLREVATALNNYAITPVVLCLSGPSAPLGAVLTEVRVNPLQRRFAFQLSWNLFGTLAAIRTIKTHRVDVIYSRLDPGMIVGWLASLLTRRPLVVEMNGLPTQDMKLYRPHNKLTLAITRSWENLMYRVANKIVGAPGYIRYINENFQVSTEKCCAVPLGINTDLFFPRDRLVCRQQLGLPNTPLAVWMGNLTVWQGLETLLQAAVLLKQYQPESRLLIVGDGISRPMCEQMIQEAGLHSTVLLVGHVPYDLVPVYLGAADVCIASFPGNRGTIGTISALKTTSYLACGRPVITTSMDELGEIIEQVGAGYSVPPDDPQAMATSLCNLLAETNNENDKRCKQAAALIGIERTWKGVTHRIAKCLRDVIA